MAQGFSFADAFRPPNQSQDQELGGFSFADALGKQEPTEQPVSPEDLAPQPGTYVSPGGAAFVPQRSGRRPQAGAGRGFINPPLAGQEQPQYEIAKPVEPPPYKDKREALDDAVNLLEEGADRAKLVEAFGRMGIPWNEIVQHGQRRNSEYFRQQAPLPGQPVPPSEPSGELKAWEPGALETTANVFKRADTSFKDMATGFLFSTGAVNAEDAAWLLRDQARRRSAAAPSGDIQRGMEAIGRSKTYGEAAEAMLRNPKATMSMLVDSLLVTTPTLAATIALAPAGAAVRAGTTFLGSGGMEYTSVMTDVLQDKGIDLADAPKVAKALQDPKIIEEMKEKGAKRGLIVGAFDALSMGLAGRFMRPANDLIAAGKLSGNAARKATVAAWGKELAMQAALGSGGEFAAQKATGEFKPADVLLEGLAEGVSAPVDVVAALREAKQITPEAQIARAIDTGVAQTGFTPSGIQASAVGAAAGVEPATIEEISRAIPRRIEPTLGEPVIVPEARVEPTLEGGPPVELIPGMPTGEELAELPPEGPPPQPGTVTPVKPPAPPTVEYGGQQYNDTPRIRSLIERATEVEAGLPPAKDGYTRLWRGNRPGEVGRATSFTNSLVGIALPFQESYGGDLSYIDVPTAKLEEYESKGAAAPGAEFGVPAEVAAQAKTVTPVTPAVEAAPKAPTVTFRPTPAAAALPETPTVAPTTTPKTFEPPPVNLEAEGLPTVEVPLSELRLSKDVPQFKLGATAEGVVEPLGGKFERVGVAPIQVWRRTDGSMEVISGRHRFDLAKRSGETTIPSQVHDEAQGFDRLKAAILDAELNIRDGQGKVKDYVNYFKESGIDRGTAESRGLLARATGKRSFTIANQGSDELIAAVRSDQIGDEAAYYVALNAPGDARLQSVGIKAIMDGKSMNTATNMMQAVKALAGENDTTVDMFGFDDSAMREAEEMAKIAAQKQREVQARLSAISGASKNPKLAAEEGIDIRNPEDVKRRIDELRQKKTAWDNWSTNPALVSEIRAARGVAPPPATAPLELVAPTPEDLRAQEQQAEEREAAEEKAIADREVDLFQLQPQVAEKEAPPEADLFAGEAAPSAEYQAALEKYRRAGEAFRKVQEAYRKQEIGDEDFLAARRVYDRATEELDRATRKERGEVPATPEEAALDLFKDGIEGREIPYSQVPNGNEAFQYAIGKTEQDGKEAIYRRRADERGTYGGWRVEADVSKLKPTEEPSKTAVPAQPKKKKEKEPENIRLARKELAETKPGGPGLTPAQLRRRQELIEWEKTQGQKATEKAAETIVNNEEPSADLPADRRLVLMPCCDMKGPQKAPAMDLYKGVFFQTFRANVQDGATPKVVILSAKHGFVLPTEEIEPYDQLMTAERADEMVANLARQLDRIDWPENIDDVLIVGGKEYQRVMRAALVELQKSGFISDDATINATSGGIGDQRKQLGEYLRSLPVSDKPQEQTVVPFEADIDVFRDALQQAEGEDERYRATFMPSVEPSKPKATKFMTPDEAKATVESWKKEAAKQGGTSANAYKTVISLFDASGEWAKPWAEAGFNVVTYDLQTGDDILEFDAEMMLENHGNDDVWAILAAPPCTDFASSGAQFWAQKDGDGRTEISNELVRQVLRTVELFRPAVWAMENPVGRIAKLNQLPPALLTFQPNLYGDPYTKKTLLWGNFNNDLPQAPVEPTEGSKIHKISGKDKYARSLTPEGFAYSFFMANNPVQMTQEDRLSRQFAGISKEDFANAGSEKDIRNAIEDIYYYNDLDRVRQILAEMRSAKEEKLPYTKEQREEAEVHAKETGGEIAWQRDQYALIRGYSMLTGDPVYVPTMGSGRARVDVTSFTGTALPPEIKEEMIAAKKQAEEKAAAKHAKEPFIKFKDGLAVSESISPEIEGILREWKNILKLDVPIYVATTADATKHRNDYTGPHRRVGSATLDTNERGSTRRMSDGSHYIVFQDSTSKTLMLEVLAHELGHIHEKRVFEKASDEEKTALRDAHLKWLEKQKDASAQELINALRGRAVQKRTKAPAGMSAQDMTSYWKSFGEWYADQMSRWAVSSKVPVTVVEKFFKRLGNQLRRFYQILTNAKYLPDETFAQYIERVNSRPVEIAPDDLDSAERMIEEPGPKDQIGFDFSGAPESKTFEFDTDASDEIVQSNSVAAAALNKAEELPKAKKKLPPGRSPELAAAAEQVLKGTMTKEEFDGLVNRYKPIPVYSAPLAPATSEQVYNSLDVLKREKINPQIPAGYQVGLRLDIPAFNRHGVFVVTIHEKRTGSSPGKPIGYTSVASIKNVKFGVGNQKATLEIAAGKAKDAIQTMEGEYVPITPEEAYRRAKEVFEGWVQIGIDPTRHAYFYDRRTTQPVLAADEVIQIGNMILARGVTYGSKSDFLFNIDSGPVEGLKFGQEEIRKQQIQQYANLKAKIARGVQEVVKGEAGIDLQRNLTSAVQAARTLQAEIRATAPRRDSAERFLAKALKEYDDGNISADVLAVIQSAYNKNPELLEGLLLSVRTDEKKPLTAGSFDAFRRIITLYKGSSGVSSPSTVRHEITHSLEQMMTPEQRMVVVQAWGKALQKAIKQNPDELHQKYFQAVLDFIQNPNERTHRLARRALPSYEMYQLINPSEFWAVNGESLMAAELGGAWDKFKRAVRMLFEGLKNVFGFDNRYAIHKVFGQIMKGNKQRLDRATLVDLVSSTEGGPFTTLENIEEDENLMKKYSRPHTPMLDTTPVKTFITRQFKNGKEFFQDAADNPRQAMVGVGDSVMDGLIYLRNKNVWYGAGLEARDFDAYNGQLRTSEGMATASVALDNAIRSGNIGVEVIFRGGIKYDPKSNNFVAEERKLGMKGVYEAEAAIKKRLGDQLGTDIIQGYLEAKRSISIMNELYEREAAYEASKTTFEELKAMGADPDEIAIAKAEVQALAKDLEAIKKAVSSVNMSEEEMQEFASLDERHPELRDLMRNWTAINQNLLRFWRQVGLLSQGRYETLSAIQDYVPWYRIMADEEDVHSPLQSTTRTLANIGREKLFKRGKPISVVDFRAAEGQKEFKIQPSSVVKVKVNGKPVNPDLVSVTPSGDVRIDMDLEAGDLVVFETNREIENIIDNMTRNVMRMTMNGIRQFAANRIVLEYASRNANGKIMVFPSVDKDKGRFNWIVNGKKVVVEIQDPLVAASIYGMENINLQMWKPLAMVANLTRRSITLSGVFQLKQVFKDAPTAALVTGVKNPLALIGGVWKGFLASLIQPAVKKVGVDVEPVVDILKAAGVGGFHSPARTPEAEIKRRLGIMNRNVFSAIIKGLDHIGDSSDMAQRVATYKRVLAETGDETQALFQAANVINFLHHGSAGYAQAVVKVVPFMGAYANAMDVLVRSLVGGGLKGVSRKKALARLAITASILTSLTLLYAMLAGGDPEYDELDDQTKLKNIIIPGTKIILPMNTSAAFFFKAIPELIYNAVTREGTENEMDRRRIRKALADVARDMLLGPEPVPAGVKPVLEVAINHDFFTGRPVIPEGLKDVAAAEQYTATTSELGKKISEMLAIPGTDDKRVLSPIEADHLVRGVFGTAGAVSQWVSNSIGAIAESRPEPTARERPITGSFLREEVPRGREDLFYDFKEAVFEKYKTWQKMIDREDFEGADKYIEKHGDVAAMYEYINETEAELKEINTEIRRLGETRAKDQTPKERREEIDEYKRLRMDILEPVKELRREVLK